MVQSRKESIYKRDFNYIPITQKNNNSTLFQEQNNIKIKLQHTKSVFF